MSAANSLARGLNSPYDAPDAWWNEDGNTPPPPKDWAHSAARGVIADLNGRGGIDSVLEGIDEETRAEIVESIAAVIRLAKEMCA